nr:hypothetical protein [uncultured Rahnella sp.]
MEDKFKNLSDSQLIKTHFYLQEKIKSHYKLRADSKHLEKAIHFCEKQIEISHLVIEAMKRKHYSQLDEVNIYIHDKEKKHSIPFYYPNHHGYKQLTIILKKQKKLEQLAKIQEKQKKEGWGNGIA